MLASDESSGNLIQDKTVLRTMSSLAHIFEMNVQCKFILHVSLSLLNGESTYFAVWLDPNAYAFTHFGRNA